MKRLIVYAEECTGCRHCELVCSYVHEGVFSPELSRITVLKDDTNCLDYPITCRNCNECPPSQTCPTTALIKTSWRIIVNKQECVSCGLCEKACSYKAINLNKEKQPLVCDLCGGDPECVKRCPTKAIRYEDREFFKETPIEAFRRMKEAWGIE